MGSPRPTEATLVVRSEGPMWSSAPTDRRGSYIDHLGQRRTAERLRRGCEGMGGNRGRDHPQRGQQFRAIPQSPFRRQLPLHKGALGTGDADCRVGPAGRPAMTMDFCHSEERSDVGIRPLYDGRGSRPPRSSAPTKRRDSCRNHPSQRRAAKRPRPRPRGMGRNRRKDHPQKGTAQAALSEAESAERAAGQIQVLPDTLRAQHGVLCSEVSAKPRPCSRRSCVN